MIMIKKLNDILHFTFWAFQQRKGYYKNAVTGSLKRSVKIAKLEISESSRKTQTSRRNSLLS